MKIDPSQPPGTIEYPGAETRTLNEGRPTTALPVRNTGERIVQVGSHYHFFEANPALAFDRKRAYGKRLEVPAGDRAVFPPGETVEVTLIPYGGDRRVRSFYGAVDGRLDDLTPGEALERFRDLAKEPLADPTFDGGDG